LAILARLGIGTLLVQLLRISDLVTHRLIGVHRVGLVAVEDLLAEIVVASYVGVRVTESLWWCNVTANLALLTVEGRGVSAYGAVFST
jgi:hypothetical protein